MRTTITITEELLEETMQISGKTKYSEAIVTALKDYTGLKRRLSFLNKLYTKKLPHQFSKIKKSRRKNKWS